MNSKSNRKEHNSHKQWFHIEGGSCNWLCQGQPSLVPRFVGVLQLALPGTRQITWGITSSRKCGHISPPLGSQELGTTGNTLYRANQKSHLDTLTLAVSVNKYTKTISNTQHIDSKQLQHTLELKKSQTVSKCNTVNNYIQLYVAIYVYTYIYIYKIYIYMYIALYI